MSDPRIKNLAKILVHYSVNVKKNEHVAVNGSVACEPLMLEIYQELLHTGAFPVIRMKPSSLNSIFYKIGKPQHFTTLPGYELEFAKNINATIGIMSEDNTCSLSNVNPGNQATFSKTLKPLREILMKKKWVGTLFPTNAYAQDAQMSLSEFEDFVYDATFASEKNSVKAWKNLSAMQDRLIKKIKGADEIRILGDSTDLTFSVKNRIFINSDGKHNMPSGEIFTGPIENSANGYITFDYPVCYFGREVDGIRLVFKNGVVVEATAQKNEKFLNTMLDMDKGARRLGELGIGTNRKIKKFIKNILFDEKIGGTIHLALGQSYPETGGKNKSALHWDMIKDLRKGGTFFVNGKPFQKNGKFV